jgi:hypothetical protein
VGRIGKNKILKIKSTFFQKRFLHGEKENFDEYFLNLASAELNFPILIDYLANKCQTCPRTLVLYEFVKTRRASHHLPQVGASITQMREEKVLKPFIS